MERASKGEVLLSVGVLTLASVAIAVGLNRNTDLTETPLTPAYEGVLPEAFIPEEVLAIQTNGLLLDDPDVSGEPLSGRAAARLADKQSRSHLRARSPVGLVSRTRNQAASVFHRR